ncbi:energy transducer TonB [Jejuia spongiicola]|uniref:Energy transducer TonB n=1 Tax=Jejuia spongiicola TaxID=2942207 RepID=A0ABT0QGT7_9FLAO|nr:energy transducer TonB [Jejuia spongiicola]MCL6296216.1 energy transducer TonB [Jejuia spongiicola]
MKKYYSISIPKPCHEDWNAMTPKEKGKFCNFCVKTVIDFTKMSSLEIQDFINENKSNRICGHFKQTQLDSININVPSHIIEQQQSFHKLFLLVLLITMGTTLMNCTNKNGSKQKIDSIEVIDSIDNKTINILGGLSRNIIDDSIQKKTYKTPSEKVTIHEVMTDGELIIETVGDIEFIETTTEIEGEIEIMEDIIAEEELVIGYLVAETPPEFKNTPQSFSTEERRDYMSKHITKIVSKNFNPSVCLEFEGRLKIQTRFEIDTLGFVKNIRARAPHSKLEEEAKRVIQLLPQFTPAKQSDKPITVVYSLPIIIQAED